MMAMRTFSLAMSIFQESLSNSDQERLAAAERIVSETTSVCKSPGAAFPVAVGFLPPIVLERRLKDSGCEKYRSLPRAAKTVRRLTSSLTEERQTGKSNCLPIHLLSFDQDIHVHLESDRCLEIHRKLDQYLDDIEIFSF